MDFRIPWQANKGVSVISAEVIDYSKRAFENATRARAIG